MTHMLQTTVDVLRSCPWNLSVPLPSPSVLQSLIPILDGLIAALKTISLKIGVPRSNYLGAAQR